MRHNVKHTLVALMSDSCYYRQRELGAVVGKVVCIEAAQLACCASATYYNDNIPHINIGSYTVQSRYYTLLHSAALHRRGEKMRIENKAVPVTGQLVAEIAVTGSR